MVQYVSIENFGGAPAPGAPLVPTPMFMPNPLRLLLLTKGRIL